jgi:hypothetical protein
MLLLLQLACTEAACAQSALPPPARTGCQQARCTPACTKPCTRPALESACLLTCSGLNMRPQLAAAAVRTNFSIWSELSVAAVSVSFSIWLSYI